MMSAEKPQITTHSKQPLKSSSMLSLHQIAIHTTQDTHDKVFTLSIEQLQRLVDPKNKQALDELGGVEGLARLLYVDLQSGLHTPPSPLLASSSSSQQSTESSSSIDNTPHPHSTLPSSHPLISPQPDSNNLTAASSSLQQRMQVYGKNELPEERQKSILQLMWIAMHDRTLILLTIVALISLLIGIYKDLKQSSQSSSQQEWIEGVAIVVAVLIVLTVQSVNDYQKEQQFRKLKAKRDDRLVKAVRDGGKSVLVSVFELCVGDVLLLEPGEVVPVDGVLIEGHNVRCDESSATGESDMVEKQAYMYTAACTDPFILSGSKVGEGVGKYLVIAVGQHSLYGKTLMGLRGGQEDTPLQVKLDRLAEKIARVGIIVALFLLLSLTVKYFITISQLASSTGRWPPAHEIADSLIGIFIEAIVIVVVAVPEGLPLAVTLALAYATKKMLKDNNLVRVLASCETMGGATTICSDKTGTLTRNEMTVVCGLLLNNLSFTNDLTRVKQQLMSMERTREMLAYSIGLNSTAFEAQTGGQLTLIGSKTETALIKFGRSIGIDSLNDLQQLRHTNASSIVCVFPFSSEKKLMALLVRENNSFCIYVKGASELVLNKCSRVLSTDSDSEYVQLEGVLRASIQQTINRYAEQSLRTIGMAFKRLSLPELNSIIGSANEQMLSVLSDSQATLFERYIMDECKSLDLLAVVGIEDPIRDEVPAAVAKCQKAGVFVRMVTGDNAVTARAIARRCGILTTGGVVMEGPRFRELKEQEMRRIIPRLQVLARSSPLDKQILVKQLKAMGETVAVTGDGTNDGPALKMADVGFSMGIAGTEVAKEASSIVLLDDNFSSIVKALLWGRAVNDSVKKFLQFQMTVNVSAVVLAFLSALLSEENESVLGPVQLLWINLIMDSLAALALATDPPTDSLLNRQPESRHASLITPAMFKMIVGQALFQIAIGLGATQLITHVYSQYYDYGIMKTFVFNTFVFMQLFNELNCRRLDANFNVFENVSKNYYFMSIMVMTVVVQWLIVQYGSIAFSTTPLPPPLWLLSIGLASFSLPLGVLIRLLPNLTQIEVCGKKFVLFEPESRNVMTKEKLRWIHAINSVQTQLSVFHALRGDARYNLSRKSSRAISTNSSVALEHVHLIP